MRADRFTFRFEETDSPPGEIALADLAAVGRHLQELATRVARWVGEIDRPGRSTGQIEQAAALRLTGLREGSTVLEVTRGTGGLLDFDVPFEEAFDERLWSVFEGIRSDAPPPGAPEGVRESAGNLLDAFTLAASRITIGHGDHAPIEFRPADLDRTVWAPATRSVEDQDIAVSGVVEMADLHSGRLRLRDDVGNTILLHGINDAEVARELLDRRADAVGRPTRDARGRISALVVSSLTAAQLPPEWTQRVHDNTWREAAGSGPDPDGGVEFSDGEWDSFLAAIGGL